jgi:hypothetical protein
VSYPVRYAVDYEPRQSRLAALFRILLALPHFIVVGVLQYAAALVALVAWFAILFTGRHPHALFRFQIGYLRWYARAQSYASFLTGRYPPFGFGSSEDGYPVRFEIEEPARLSRPTTFFRWLLIIPAVVVWYLVGIVGAVVWVIAWVVTVVLGRLPQGTHDVLEFVLRYSLRFQAYSLLVTDRFPWFQPEDGVPPAAEPTPPGSLGVPA